MSKYSIPIDELATIIKGTLLQKSFEDSISQISIDSRKVKANDELLFFAIKGDRNDGHKYIDELIEKGIRNFVISDVSVATRNEGKANFILVKNGVEALQSIARDKRQHFTIPIIAITGSNGKTVVKEWLDILLNKEFDLVKSPKSYNSQVGVPLSVWGLNDKHQLGIFEAGISKPGEMEKLASIIEPSIGIITNIGAPHAENFEDNTHKTKEKLKLFRSAKQLIFCGDYDEILKEVGLLYIHHPKQVFQWSRQNNEANLYIQEERIDHQHCYIQALYKKERIKFSIPFTDRASIENALHCIATMLLLEYEVQTIEERIQHLKPISMRMQMLDGINNCTLISDVYTADIGSLEIALDFLIEQKRHPHRTVILSDLMQSGIPDQELYQMLARMIAERKVEKFIGIGPKMIEFQDYFHQNSYFFEDADRFLLQENISFSNESILIKGARVFGLEKVTKVLQQKSHETILEVNLNDMLQNLNYYRSKLKPNVKLMVMVKAFSYGSGIYEVANFLEYNRVDYLAVAYPDEGVELRKAGITLPIMVMNAELSAYRLMVKYHLEPEIYSMRTLKAFCNEVAGHPEFSGEHLIHLKIETGMHRLGFEEDEIDDMITQIKSTEGIKIKSVFSHLSSAPDTEHDEFSKDQIHKFERVSQRIIGHFDYPILLHTLNTSGIERFPQYQFNMVRLGLGLYGLGFTPESKEKLVQAGSLKTIISQIKRVKKGDSVGYGRAFVATKEMKIATIPIGYADGLMRSLGNGKGKVWIAGNKLPFVGNICMDMAMIDLQGFDCQEGDEVVIFGKELPVEEFAENMATIPYEALTHISRRVKRIYYQE